MHSNTGIPSGPARRRAGAAEAAALAVALSATLATALLAGAGPARAEGVPGIGVSGSQAAQVLATRPLRRLDGAPLSLADARGHVVVLDFWASWCAPCRRELPRLQALAPEIERQGGRVITVSLDEDRRNVELFAQRNDLTLPVVLDGPGGLARALDLRAVPCTLVLDRDGRVAFGTTRSDEAGLAEVLAATRQLLAARPVALEAASGGAR